MIKEQRCLNTLGEKFGSKAQLLKYLSMDLILYVWSALLWA